MARNGSGTAQKAVSDFTTGTTISSTDMNTLVDDIIDMLTDSVSKDGQTVITGTIDFNGNEIVLDADGDTSITSDTDDQIDFKVAGADDFRVTANTFTALSGSTIATNTIAETTTATGVTIDGVLLKDNGITATGGGSLTGTWTDLGSVTTIDINGGTVDGAIIGGASAAAGTFTTLAGTTSVVAASDITITSGSIVSASGSITFGNENLSTTGTLAAGATTITGALTSNADDGGALGASGTGWSDLFLASGAVVNFNAGDVTLTHSANTLTLGGGNLALGTGTLGGSGALTFTGGGSLTGTWSDLGTVTTVDINGGTIDGATIGGSSAGAGTFTSLNATGGGALTGTWTDLGSVTTVDINGGTVDGVTIGGSSAAAGSFTTLGASSYLSRSVTTGITAGTTQTQAGATALTTDINEISVCGTSGDGVALPTASAGKRVTVINNGAEAAQIWPATSDSINGGAADAVDASTLAAGDTRTYVAKDATSWYAEGESVTAGVDTSGTPTLNDFARFTDADTIEGRSYAEVRADLSLEVGTDVQAYDAGLASIAGLTTAADKMPYTTASDTYAVTDLSAFGRTLIDDADASAARTTLGVVIGTDVQAYDADTLKADTYDTITAGFDANVDNDGIKSSSTYAPIITAGTNYKKIVNGGSFSLQPPSPDNDKAITMSMLIVNNATAGTITTTAFTKVTGDAFTTTNGDEFLCRLETYDIGGTEFSLLDVVAMQ